MEAGKNSSFSRSRLGASAEIYAVNGIRPGIAHDAIKQGSIRIMGVQDTSLQFHAMVIYPAVTAWAI